MTFSDQDVDDYVRPFASLGGVRGAAAHVRAIPESAEQNRKLAERKLRMPVLTIGAARSYRDSIEHGARQFAVDVSGLVAEHSGHWIAEEQPSWLAEQLVTFFAAKMQARAA